MKRGKNIIENRHLKIENEAFVESCVFADYNFIANKYAKSELWMLVKAYFAILMSNLKRRSSHNIDS